MAASLSDLKAQIEAAERLVHAADARAAESARLLKAHWSARGPTILIGVASTLLAWQVLRGRRRERHAAGFGPRSSWARALDSLIRYGSPKLMTGLTALIAGLVAKKTKKPLVTAPAVDLERYCGTWYEIARMPEKTERDCASDVTATYELTIDGGLRIANRCRRRDGSLKRAIGRAEVVEPDTNAKLRVSYAPQLLDPLPFVWSDYYIIDVASDYSTAVVGTPDRAHLWLLARESTVTEEVRSSFIAKALGQGFDTSQLIYGRHTAAANAGPQAGEPGQAPDVAAVAPTAATNPQQAPSTNYDRPARQGEQQL